jgi:hypothetical protein
LFLFKLRLHFSTVSFSTKSKGYPTQTDLQYSSMGNGKPFFAPAFPAALFIQSTEPMGYTDR